MLEKGFAVRLSQEQWRKLEQLERITRRSKGAVMRLLLDAAVPTGQREIKLARLRCGFAQIEEESGDATV